MWKYLPCLGTANNSVPAVGPCLSGARCRRAHPARPSRCISSVHLRLGPPALAAGPRPAAPRSPAPAADARRAMAHPASGREQDGHLTPGDMAAAAQSGCCRALPCWLPSGCSSTRIRCGPARALGPYGGGEIMLQPVWLAARFEPASWPHSPICEAFEPIHRDRNRYSTTAIACSGRVCCQQLCPGERRRANCD